MHELSCQALHFEEALMKAYKNDDKRWETSLSVWVNEHSHEPRDNHAFLIFTLSIFPFSSEIIVYKMFTQPLGLRNLRWKSLWVHYQ